ncbi:CDC16-like protein [Lachancea thermotolerans]|uniref:KLTH0C00572p n=1 Tax=Lachancea thermotolerans (strain ATCC 56472 / CBS 6340 / NRRL Y-8284) TaxID=559295 RepID=C5DDF4_LACTC|nr:KLTH0C00572p [Lachancea thermotolerans CBS 6340]CAR21815.1 KLTH0C00572p [Lachancea thermotolerans CBS 6340]
MSRGNTPSQHNSTLAISPLVGSRSLQVPQQRNAANASSTRQWSGSHRAAQTPHHSVTYSPLVQKIQNNASLATPAPVQDHGSTAGLLASMTKNGLFGPTMPSTLRKVSILGDARRQSTSIDNAASDAAGAEDRVADDRLVQDIDIAQLPAAEKLRLWRHDSLMQHQYRTAEYIGDKVYAMTGDPNDAFWLAQVYYNSGSYIRAVELLTRNNLDTSSVMCRYLTALCLIQLKKYEDALDIVGETNPFRDPLGNHVKNQDGGIKLESSMCYLRGKIFSALNNFDKAKESLKEALLVDVKNFEAFDELISKNLLTPTEQWTFISSLDFSDLDDNEELIKSLYITKLSKYLNLDQVHNAHEFLGEEYKLDNNTDLIQSNADTLFTQCKFSECLKLCEEALEKDEFNFSILPIYISCLYELGGKNKLFLVSHKMAENFPKHPITWFGVGAYYMCTNKISEARKYFSKASILDPSFSQAWIGFAHTYAVEGEHEQAVSAYSTASRYFPGTHLPNLFLGMQYLLMGTLPLAEEYFALAYDICPYDPLLLNEMGVLYFKKNDYLKAKRYLKKAWEAIKALDSESKSWISIHTNLAHTYRKLGDNERAVKCFRLVLETTGKDADTLCALGYVYLRMNRIEKAIDSLHSSLALRPSNQAAQDLLKQALDVNLSTVLDESHPLVISSKLQEQGTGTASKKRTANILDVHGVAKKLKHGQDSSDDEDSMDLE